MEDAVEDEYDEVVGRNVRQLRDARGMNQEQLASECRAHGLSSFRQQTVVKIEKGQRPLRLREAHQIATVLEVHLDQLVSEQPVIDLAAVLISETTELTRRWEELTNVVIRMERARWILKSTIDRIGRRSSPISQSLLNEAYSKLQVDPIKVVQAAMERGFVLGTGETDG